MRDHFRLKPVAILLTGLAGLPSPVPASAQSPAPATTLSATTIHVVSASLGGVAFSQSCDASEAVMRQCDGRRRCAVSAATSLCPLSDPAHLALIASLVVQYRCTNSDKIRTVSVERPFELRIACPLTPTH